MIKKNSKVILNSMMDNENIISISSLLTCLFLWRFAFNQRDEIDCGLKPENKKSQSENVKLFRWIA